MMKSLALLLILATLAVTGCAASSITTGNANPVGSAIAATPIHLFRGYLSGADGHRCPMTPSCSRYALTAIERHGAWMGWIMACDRLMRCGRDELRRSPAVMTPSAVQTRDTIENNDFWWH